RLCEALCHSWIAVCCVQINQACATSNHRSYHAFNGTTQRFFERRKSRRPTSIVYLVLGGRCDGPRRCFGCVTARDALTNERASAIFGQAFGADDPRKKSFVGEVLLDCAHCFLAGQKH